ncbi:T9SS type A sorting domain-containing protein, partial [Candidatus Poribacteria bacterium]|nr:T9SS type A sorting domain-containing protein [Candidatus Poribacteria bacterium]
PIGPAPVLDAFIEGKNPFPRLSRDYRKEIPHNLFDQTWYLRAYTENYENAGFTICWDNINFPDDLSVFITPVDDTGKAIGPSIDIKSRLCFAEAFVAGKSHRFRIRVSQTQCITLSLKAGWNMNSCPGEPAIKDVATLVANTSVLPYIYSWDPVANNYVMVSEIDFGMGYWLAAIEDTQLNICYFPKSSLSKLVKTGWNMVGSLSCLFPVSKLPSISLPADAILTYVYTWNSANGNTYILVDNIEPGIGYWVGALDDALLNMNCAQLAPIRQIKPLYKVQVPSWESVLEIQIGSFIQQLTFGMHPSASSGFDKAFDVPIPPTLGMVNNSLKAHWNIQDEYFPNLSSSYIKDEPHGIWELILELSEPGIVRWRNLPQSYSCILKWHSQIIRMQTENSLELPSGKHVIKLEVDSLKTRPEKTQLSANYPNPCNPETWIPYCLSEDSEVNIIIHDVSGREVRRIYMGNQLAGRYEDKERAAYWDGKNERGEIVSSGIYFYTLKTAGVSQTRKMTMIR